MSDRASEKGLSERVLKSGRELTVKWRRCWASGERTFLAPFLAAQSPAATDMAGSVGRQGGYELSGGLALLGGPDEPLRGDGDRLGDGVLPLAGAFEVTEVDSGVQLDAG